MNFFNKEQLKEFEQQAKKECNSPETTAHHGGAPGRPFWNCEATQFMYVPSFHFPHIPGCFSYRFTARDEKEREYSFVADEPTALLTPIWSDLPEGVVYLTVTALDDTGKDTYPAGSRTFFKLAPFDADLPGTEISYKEALGKAFDYVMKQKFLLHWLEKGVPDPSYDLNIYPCKMISSIVSIMLSYAGVYPEKKETAVKIARSAADYLLSITPDGSAALPWLPPTYSFDFCPDPDRYGIRNGNWKQAELHRGTTMLIYPASAGRAFLQMEKETGESGYLDAALKIGDFFEKHVEENGSWKITWSETTGQPAADNYADPLGQITPFLMELYSRTGEEKWRTLAEGSIAYLEKTVLRTYNWEGQFEDSVLSSNYSNLTHFGTLALVRYYARYRRDDEQAMKCAEELMRFAEDQFVVWRQGPPWYDTKREYDPKLWHTPGVLEQYHWYTPIDSSAAVMADTMLAMYQAGRGDIYLAKALTLTDQLVIMQEEDGKIPTHWSDCENARKDFWMNCMFASIRILGVMAELTE